MVGLKSFTAAVALLPIVAVHGAQSRDLHQDKFQSETVGPVNQPVDLGEYQTVLYVAPGGTGSGSRDEPLPSPAAALERIAGAPVAGRCAIIVAAGTYATVDLQMKSNVDLFGGFAAGEWSRDIFRNETVLDAGKKGRVLIGADEARLDGFTVTGGRIRGHGGAIVCRDVSPSLTNNIFIDNGTLIPSGYDVSKKHQLAHCGGAIYTSFNAIPIVANNIFSGNTTELGDGGAIYCYELARPKDKSQPLIRNNVFLGNKTGLLNPDAQPKASAGGAIACGYNALPTIVGNVFVGNLSGDHSDGGALFCAYSAMPLVLKNWFVGNGAADSGGGMAVKSMSEPIIDGNIFAGNWAIASNSGIRLNREGRAIITNNLFVHNQSNGIGCTNSWMTCSNNTIMENKGSGILYSNMYSYFGPSIVRNNIIRDNESSGIDVTEGAKGPLPEITHNDVQGGVAGPGNIGVNPQFIEDGVRGRIAGMRRDGFTSVLKVAGVKWPSEEMSGRVVRVGERWSVVKENDTASLTVWGDMTVDREGDDSNPATSFLIIPTYTQTAGSPAKAMGFKPLDGTRIAD